MREVEPHQCPGLQHVRGGGSSDRFADTQTVALGWNTSGRRDHWELRIWVRAPFGNHGHDALVPITHCPFCGEKLE